MLTFAQACELAETWVRAIRADGVVILKEATIKQPYRWVLFYQTSAVLVRLIESMLPKSSDYRRSPLFHRRPEIHLPF